MKVVSWPTALLNIILKGIGIYEEKADENRTQEIRKAAATGDTDTLSRQLDRLRRKKRGLLGGNKQGG